MENLIKIHGSVGTHLSFKMLILSNVFLQNELTYVAKHSPTWLMYQGFWSLNGNPIPVICLQFFFLAFLAWKLFLKSITIFKCKYLLHSFLGKYLYKIWDYCFIHMGKHLKFHSIMMEKFASETKNNIL